MNFAISRSIDASFPVTVSRKPLNSERNSRRILIGVIDPVTDSVPPVPEFSARQRQFSAFVNRVIVLRTSSALGLPSRPVPANTKATLTVAPLQNGHPSWFLPTWTRSANAVVSFSTQQSCRTGTCLRRR